MNYERYKVASGQAWSEKVPNGGFFYTPSSSQMLFCSGVLPPHQQQPQPPPLPPRARSRLQAARAPPAPAAPSPRDTQRTPTGKAPRVHRAPPLLPPPSPSLRAGLRFQVKQPMGGRRRRSRPFTSMWNASRLKKHLKIVFPEQTDSARLQGNPAEQHTLQHSMLYSSAFNLLTNVLFFHEAAILDFCFLSETVTLLDYSQGQRGVIRRKHFWISQS
ncbi:uncharacterized protein LOC125451549 [Stegostoma tigrinum]|uniref:uncharacterized protein LOC125451549 n=1 Tax=Stegostoma tigrinum TaxID=3053191 RepID=UPI002870ACF7|nr:uncharacterized protein LOC125451549 [Stegostoma tigrinum]